MKAGPDVTGHVYVQTDRGWELSANKVPIPEGWYLGPPREAEK